MSTIAHIRKNVLGLSQRELADIAGATQATVSRWESGEHRPDLEHLTKIRAYAIAQGKEWNDEWFFVPPSDASEQVPVAEPAQ